MLSQVSQAGAYPHSEVGTPFNPNFVIETVQRKIVDEMFSKELAKKLQKKIKKEASPKQEIGICSGDPGHFIIPNIGDMGILRHPLNSQMFRNSLLIVDSHPLAGMEPNHLRRVGVDSDTGMLSAPTIIKVSLFKLLRLLDPDIIGVPRLGHTVDCVQSGPLSIPRRTHRILALSLKEYDHWDDFAVPSGTAGFLTFDALFRAYRTHEPITHRYYTPGDSETNPQLETLIIGSKGGNRNRRSGSRKDPTGVWA